MHNRLAIVLGFTSFALLQACGGGWQDDVGSQTQAATQSQTSVVTAASSLGYNDIGPVASVTDPLTGKTMSVAKPPTELQSCTLPPTDVPPPAPGWIAPGKGWVAGQPWCQWIWGVYVQRCYYENGYCDWYNTYYAGVYCYPYDDNESVWIRRDVESSSSCGEPHMSVPVVR